MMRKNYFLKMLTVACLSVSSAFATDTTVVYNYLPDSADPDNISKGQIQTFTVPPGVTSITIQAVGAGKSQYMGSGNDRKGANLTQTFTVTPLQTLYIVVGNSAGSSGGSGCSLVSTESGPPFTAANTFIVAGGASYSNDAPLALSTTAEFTGGTSTIGGISNGTAGGNGGDIDTSVSYSQCGAGGGGGNGGRGTGVTSSGGHWGGYGGGGGGSFLYSGGGGGFNGGNVTGLSGTDSGGTSWVNTSKLQNPSSTTTASLATTHLASVSITYTKVASPITISVQPDTTSRNYAIGATATELSVDAIGGTFPYTYQWYRNTTNSNVGGTKVLFAYSKNFTPPTDSNGAYYYYAIATELNDTTQKATSNVSGKITVGTPLNIIFGKLSVINVNNDNIVSWNTLSEGENDIFEVEKSNDGQKFVTISRFVSQNKPSEYLYTDKNVGRNTSYYRIKIINGDGGIYYSPISSAISKNNDILTVNPNPTKDIVNIKYPLMEHSGATISVLNIEGKLLQKFENLTGSHLEVSLKDYPNGVYFLKYSNDVISDVITIIKK